MPISVTDLITQTGLSRNELETVQWGQKPKSSKIGIYIISTSNDPSQNKNLFTAAPIDNDILEFWIKKVTTLQIDKNIAPTTSQLGERLSQFWLSIQLLNYCRRRRNLIMKGRLSIKNY